MIFKLFKISNQYRYKYILKEYYTFHLFIDFFNFKNMNK